MQPRALHRNRVVPEEKRSFRPGMPPHPLDGRVGFGTIRDPLQIRLRRPSLTSEQLERREDAPSSHIGHDRSAVAACRCRQKRAVTAARLDILREAKRSERSIPQPSPIPSRKARVRRMDVQNCRDSHPGTSERESVDRRKRPARPLDGSPGNSQFEAPQGLPCSNDLK